LFQVIAALSTVQTEIAIILQRIIKRYSEELLQWDVVDVGDILHLPFFLLHFKHSRLVFFAREIQEIVK
jgi:hypothetical protein